MAELSEGMRSRNQFDKILADAEEQTGEPSEVLRGFAASSHARLDSLPDGLRPVEKLERGCTWFDLTDAEIGELSSAGLVPDDFGEKERAKLPVDSEGRLIVADNESAQSPLSQVEWNRLIVGQAQLESAMINFGAMAVECPIDCIYEE